MSIASVYQNNMAATGGVAATSVVNPYSPESSQFTDAVQSVSSTSSSSAETSGTTDLFQKLASDLQAMLLQLQNSDPGSNPSPGSNTGGTTNAGTTGTSDSAAVGAAQARHHHHHHDSADASATNGPGKLESDASRLLGDLTREQTANGHAASLATSSASSSPGVPSTNGYQNSLAAIQASSSTGAQAALVSGLGLV